MTSYVPSRVPGLRAKRLEVERFGAYTVSMASGPAPSERVTPALPDAGHRVQMKRWLETWQRVGPILDTERWARLAAMSDAEAQRASQRVLELWQPDWHGDDGEALLLHQRVFARRRR